MNIGKAIQQLRMERHLSQTSFAERCGITNTYLSAIEGGSKEPGTKVLKKLAIGLGIPVSEIMKKAESLDQK